jgi:transposase
MAKKKHKRTGVLRGPGNCYPVELRLRVVREVVDHGAEVSDVSRTFGISETTVHVWLDRFRRGGVDALVPEPPGAKPQEDRYDPRREAVIETRRAHPEWGAERIRDVLARFAAVGVSETTVRRVLADAGLVAATAPSGPREHPPRRFERAEPNQLWAAYEQVLRCAEADDEAAYFEAVDRLRRAQEVELSVLGPAATPPMSIDAIMTRADALLAHHAAHPSTDDPTR